MNEITKHNSVEVRRVTQNQIVPCLVVPQVGPRLKLRVCQQLDTPLVGYCVHAYRSFRQRFARVISLNEEENAFVI